MALKFSGGGGRLKLPNDADLLHLWQNNGTLTMRVRKRADFGGDVKRIISAQAASGETIWYFGAWYTWFRLRQDFDTAWTDYRTGVDTFPPGEWIHVALHTSEVAGEIPVIYLNGVYVGVAVDVPSSGTPNLVTEDLIIGSRIGGDEEEWDGDITDVRMYSGDMSHHAATLHSLNGDIGPIDGLIARWPMSPNVAGQVSSTPFVDAAHSTSDESFTISVSPPVSRLGDLLVLKLVDSSDTATSPNITTPDGWELVQHFDIPASGASKPAVAIFTKTAGASETAVVVTSNQDSSKAAIMSSYRGPSQAYDKLSLSSGDSTTVTGPATIALTENCLVLRIYALNGQIALLPQDVNINQRASLFAPVGASNDGATVGFAEESWDASATEDRSWEVDAGGLDAEWVCVTVAFPWGKGTKGLDVVDLSSYQRHLQTVGEISTTPDDMAIQG